MKFLIDNGHGEETPGNRSQKWEDGTQLFEWEYTREIAAEVVKRCKAAGLDAQLLTPEKNDVPLYERVIRANKLAKIYGAKNTLVVSIHNNAANKKAHGWEVHTYLGQSISDTYAKVFWNIAKEKLAKTTRPKMRGDHADGDPDFDSNFAILRDTVCPAVMTENLFMDNEEDCRFLLSEEGKEAIIQIHTEAIKAIEKLS
jgi:N-acetylmuramoyl-L-alanine amidase